MATIKSYSDLQQSKKLAEFLPLESADMYYMEASRNNYNIGVLRRMERDMLLKQAEYYKMSPCWSLAALLGVASIYCSKLEITLRADKKYNVFAVKGDFVFRSFNDHPDGFDNLINACVAMIEKLHESNLL